jgi:UDP-N-acetylmuramoyl-L-alanyl-D-glutamate--2,6-diaminopimelate ligase
VTLGDLLSATATRAPFDALAPAPIPGSAAGATVAAVTSDSRAVSPGSVFVALKGLKADGVSFARDAIGRGAVAVAAEGPRPDDLSAAIPWLQVPDARLALAALSASFFGNPSVDLVLVGITGTNGKTTTAYLLASIFEAAGIKCGRIGTVGYQVGGREIEATRTTPEAPDLQRMLREMVTAGCGACVIEASSHALALRRVDYLHFSAVVFSNLTRDHLDFHRDMEDYFAAKRRLFEMLPADAPALINVDDPRGASLVEVVKRPVTYAINKPADVSPGPLSYSLAGLDFEIRTPRGGMHVRSRLVGKPNVYNILGAVGTALELGVPVEAIEEGLQRLPGVPGRFEVVSSTADDVTVVVDYAHTDDALRNLLETARPMATRRLITVFGAGGDRDRTKRPLMGMVAARLSDVVVITSDNPRSEDPERIIEEVKRGADAETRQSNASIVTEVDRREAILQAVSGASPGDVVLIAGKGHEKYQEIGGRRLAFDDIEVAREALEARRVKSRA